MTYLDPATTSSAVTVNGDDLDYAAGLLSDYTYVSVCTWFVQPSGGTNLKYLLGFDQTNHVAFRVNSGTSFMATNDTGTQRIATSTATLARDTWIFACGTWDFSAAGNTITAQVNETADATNVLTNSTAPDSSDTFNIGPSAPGNLIRDLRVYGTVLSRTQRVAIYNAQRTLYVDAGRRPSPLEGVRIMLASATPAALLDWFSDALGIETEREEIERSIYYVAHDPVLSKPAFRLEDPN